MMVLVGGVYSKTVVITVLVEESDELWVISAISEPKYGSGRFLLLNWPNLGLFGLFGLFGLVGPEFGSFPSSNWLKLPVLCGNCEENCGFRMLIVDSTANGECGMSP